MKNMEMTGIISTNTSKFLITFRNEDNSKFYIRPKSDFERELILIEENQDKDKQPIVTSPHEGVKDESEIIEMINSGTKFYTYNYEDKTFTKIVEVDGHIKTESNETDVDNIDKLPLLG